MARRTGIAFTVVAIALALATPALAGGWAVVTLDTLPREVRAGQALQIGFMVRQHGKTPTNLNLNGEPLAPVLTAQKQDAGAAKGGGAADAGALRVEARQEGAVGHFVADVSFPADGVWSWQIELPTFYVQSSASGGPDDAAIFAPLTVLPAAPAPAPQPAETTVAGLSPAALRWIAALLLVLAAGVALFARRGASGRRHAAQPQPRA
jgi:hypothetical protein